MLIALYCILLQENYKNKKDKRDFQRAMSLNEVIIINVKNVIPNCLSNSKCQDRKIVQKIAIVKNVKVQKRLYKERNWIFSFQSTIKKPLY